MKLPEWRTCSAPRRRSASRAARASPRCRPASSPRSTRPRRAPRRRRRLRVARRPDQGRGRPRAGHPPRPVPADRDQHRARSAPSPTAAGGPIVLTVNSTGGSLAELAAVVGCHERVLRVRRGRRVHHRRVGEPGAGCSSCRRGAGRQRRHREVREAAGRPRSPSTCASVLNDLPPPDDRPLPAALELAAPVEQAFVLGPIGLGYDRGTDRVLVQLEELSCRRRRRGRAATEAEQVDEDRRARPRPALPHAQPGARVLRHAEGVVAAGRPTCMWCGEPDRPDGHPAPG